jgi:hypothetical protein
VYTASRRPSRHSAAIGQKLCKEPHLGSFSEIWCGDLQSLEGGKWKEPPEVINRHLMIHWLYAVMVFLIFWAVSEQNNWKNNCQIFRKINIEKTSCYYITAYLNWVTKSRRIWTVGSELESHQNSTRSWTRIKNDAASQCLGLRSRRLRIFFRKFGLVPVLDPHSKPFWMLKGQCHEINHTS